MSQLFQIAARGGTLAVVEGTAAPTSYANGLPIVGGALAIDMAGAIAGYHMGIPLTATGRVATSLNAVARFNDGTMPLDAAGRVSLSGSAVAGYSAGLPYTATGAIAVTGLTVWTPRALFTGQPGFYYEAGIGMTSLGFHRCYQDAARTIPSAAIGDPVRSISDLSGNNVHIFAVAPQIPELQMDAKGWYIRLGGVNSAIQAMVVGCSHNITNGLNLAVCIGDSAGGFPTAGSTVRYWTGNNTSLFFNSDQETAAQLVANYNGSNFKVTSISVPAGTLAKTCLMQVIPDTSAQHWLGYIDGSPTPIPAYSYTLGFAMSGVVTQILMDRTFQKLRSVLGMTNRVITMAEWAQLDAYWRGAGFTGANPI